MREACLSLLAGLLLAAPLAAQDATYAVRISLNWSLDTAASLPDNPHWSRLIAFAHSDRYALFNDGDTASSGLALVATNGRVSVLEAELGEGRRRGRVADHRVLPGVPDGTGEFEFDLSLSEKHNHVSFATMLAPSPDWFTGVSGVALHVRGAWLQNITVPLWVWDAGADSGPDFQSPNAPTQPRQSVRLLTHPSFLTPTGLQPIGTATFTRLE